MSQNLQNFVNFQKFQLENLVDFEKFCKTEFLDQNDLVSDLRGRFPLPVFSVQAA